MMGYLKSVCITGTFLRLTIEEESPKGKLPCSITHVIHAADMSTRDLNTTQITNRAAPEYLQNAACAE